MDETAGEVTAAMSHRGTDLNERPRAAKNWLETVLEGNEDAMMCRGRGQSRG